MTGVAFLVSTVVTALALAMDAAAVSVAAGLARGRASVRDAFVVAGVFGGFQGGMPLLGAWLGATLRPYVERFAPLLAGLVLVLLGLYAVHESRQPEEEGAAIDFFSPSVLFGLGVATSIDAFAVGVSLSLAGAPLLPSAAIIGGVTFGISFLAVRLADRLEGRLGGRAELVGGLALVLLGAFAIFEAF